MTPLDRLTIALFVWAFLLVLLNPFLEGKKLRVAAFACAVAGSICFVFGGNA